MTQLNRRQMIAASFAAAAMPSDAFAQTVPTGKVELEVFALASSNWQLVIDRFMTAYPNIKINYTRFGTDDFKQALRVGASSGKLPDVWWNWGGSLASSYNNAGHSLKITPEILKEQGIDAVLNQTAIDIAAQGGQLYGIPHKTSPFTFIYKKPLFAKFNLTEPKSLAELEKIADTLKANKITPFSCGGKFSWMTMRYFDFFLETFAGSQGHDDFLDMKRAWTEEPVIKSFAKLKEWNDKGYFPQGFLNVDPSTATSALYSDQAGIVFEVISVETTRIQREGQKVEDYGSFPLPTSQPKLRVPGSPSQYQVNAKTTGDKRAAALLFAAFVVKPENAPTTAAATGFMSATKGILPDANLPMQRKWAELTASEVGYYRLTDQGLPQEVVAAFFEAQDGMLLGGTSPKDAGQQVQEAIDRFKKRAN